jgi:hypothetical protein
LGITFFAIDSAAFSPFRILAFIVFPVVFGWKLMFLSRAN